MATVGTVTLTDSDISSQKPGRAVDKLTIPVTALSMTRELVTVNYPTAYSAAPSLVSVASVGGIMPTVVVNKVQASSVSLLLKSDTAEDAATITVLLQRTI